MQLGKPEIVKCPSCGKKQQRPTLMSGNTFGARFYSDGKRDAPMLPQFPCFVKCPDCEIFFKITRNVIKKKIIFNRDPEIPRVSFLTVDELLQAIESGLVNSDDGDDILSLRLELWRALNAPIRQGRKEVAKKSLYEENCRMILSELTKLTDDEAYLMCAELWRNVGEFNQCTIFLKKIKSLEKYKDYIAAIDAACNAQNTLTLCVDRQNPQR